MKLKGQLQWTDYLNAQLLHLKPNKLVKIIWYVALLGMPLIIIDGLNNLYLLVTGEYYSGPTLMFSSFVIFFLIMFVLYRYVLLPNQTKKIFNQQKELQAPFEVEFTDANLVVSNEFGSAIRPWKHFTKWKENEELLMLYLSDVIFTIIPKRMFADAQQIETIKSYLSKSKVAVATSYSIKSYIFFFVLFIIAAVAAFTYVMNSQ